MYLYFFKEHLEITVFMFFKKQNQSVLQLTNIIRAYFRNFYHENLQPHHFILVDRNVLL